MYQAWRLSICVLVALLTSCSVAVAQEATLEEDHGIRQTNSDKDTNELHKKLEHRKPRHLLEDDDEYLCEVYKKGVGGLIWKDESAAKRQHMDICTYTIGGIDPQLKKGLAIIGRKADELHIDWQMSSAFRDDYRQSIATGLRARPGYSQHGNSKVTKGYGFGRAVDINGSPKAFFGFLDRMGAEFGLHRPHSFDPGHVQLMTVAKARTRTNVRISSTKVRVVNKTKTQRYVKVKRTKHKATKVARDHRYDGHANEFAQASAGRHRRLR